MNGLNVSELDMKMNETQVYEFFVQVQDAMVSARDACNSSIQIQVHWISDGAAIPSMMACISSPSTNINKADRLRLLGALQGSDLGTIFLFQNRYLTANLRCVLAHDGVVLALGLEALPHKYEPTVDGTGVDSRRADYILCRPCPRAFACSK